MKELPPAPNFLSSIYAVASVRGEQIPSVTVPQQPATVAVPPKSLGSVGEQDTHPQQKPFTKCCISFVPKHTS